MIDLARHMSDSSGGTVNDAWADRPPSVDKDYFHIFGYVEASLLCAQFGTLSSSSSMLFTLTAGITMYVSLCSVQVFAHLVTADRCDTFKRMKLVKLLNVQAFPIPE